MCKIKKIMGKSSRIVEHTSHPFKTLGIKTVNRIIEVDKNDIPKYKFLEKITWEQNTKMAVCIGLNPAKADKELDVTNNRLIRLLREYYSGYILLNLYPEITSKKSLIRSSDKINKNFDNKIIKYIDCNFKSNDIILFFGRTTKISYEFALWLKKCLKKNRKIKKVVSNDLFTHPCTSNNLSLADFNENDYKITIV